MNSFYCQTQKSPNQNLLIWNNYFWTKYFQVWYPDELFLIHPILLKLESYHAKEWSKVCTFDYMFSPFWTHDNLKNKAQKWGKKCHVSKNIHETVENILKMFILKIKLLSLRWSNFEPLRWIHCINSLNRKIWMILVQLFIENEHFKLHKRLIDLQRLRFSLLWNHAKWD